MKLNELYTTFITIIYCLNQLRGIFWVSILFIAKIWWVLTLRKIQKDVGLSGKFVRLGRGQGS